MAKKKVTLLCVDDEASILGALKRLFRRDGYNVLTAEGGEQGLEILREHEVNVIISDQRMPGMIGAEFLAASKEVSPHSIRLMLTGFSDVESARRAINEGGVYRYVNKPWGDDDLKEIVRGAVARFDLEEENRCLTHDLQQFNAELERQVDERTSQLELKVRELKGRDRIAQHMLAVHTLEETLELVLLIVSEILQLDKAVVFLGRDVHQVPTAAVGVFAPAQVVPTPRLAAIEIADVQTRAFEVVAERRTAVNIKEPENAAIPPFAVVPILKGEELLGVLEVDNHRSARPISDEELETLASFALQAAVAISDAQSHKDFGEWKIVLDKMLKEVAVDDWVTGA